jgi:hypothetical protein
VIVDRNKLSTAEYCELADISEAALGYREGRIEQIVTEIERLKAIELKSNYHESIGVLIEKFKELGEIAEDLKHGPV